MVNLLTRSMSHLGQTASWVVRKYVRFLVIGAFSTCAFLNLALHAGAGLQYYCREECVEGIMRRPVPSLDSAAVAHIRKVWVDEPAPPGLYKPDFSLDNPPWSALSNWGEAYKFVNNYFKNYEKPGTFMEIGAQDGEFMSLTLFVEQQLGFRGVLVEPNPFDYQKLRAMRRPALSINACATPAGGHRKDKLWLRYTPENLPSLLRRVQEGSNRLVQYVSPEDQDLGKTVDVQCFNAGAMALAALRTAVVDLLVISTHGGELDILYSISLRVHFRMVVLMVPLATQEEIEELKKVAKSRGLTPAFDKHSIHILIPEHEVKYV
ncbi:uncharacterized protein [Procambarus clarkii]|uniref:uncharacterized protein n=1 Tax=Procambarus clarkii TaxID=6728 RepID=UPI001E6764A6|nr:uncharacterized protein LOC123755561 [Procambarus clarkii]